MFLTGQQTIWAVEESQQGSLTQLVPQLKASTHLLMLILVLLQAYRKLAKEYHPDKNPDAGDKVWSTTAFSMWKQQHCSAQQGQKHVNRRHIFEFLISMKPKPKCNVHLLINCTLSVAFNIKCFYLNGNHLSHPLTLTLLAHAVKVYECVYSYSYTDDEGIGSN